MSANFKGQSTLLLVSVGAIAAMIAGAVAFGQMNRLPELFKYKTNDISEVTRAETRGETVNNYFAPLAAEFSAGEATYQVISQTDQNTNEYSSFEECLDQPILNNNLNSNNDNGDASEFPIFDRYQECADTLSTEYFDNYSKDLDYSKCDASLNFTEVSVADSQGDIHVIVPSGTSLINVICRGDSVESKWKSEPGKDLSDDMERNTFPEQITLLHGVVRAMERTAEKIEDGVKLGSKSLHGLGGNEKGSNALVGEFSFGQNACYDNSTDSDGDDDATGPDLHGNAVDFEEIHWNGLPPAPFYSDSELDQLARDVVQAKFNDAGPNPPGPKIGPVGYKDITSGLPLLSKKDGPERAKGGVLKTGRCQALKLTSNNACGGVISSLIDIATEIADSAGEIVPYAPDFLSRMDYNILGVEWKVDKEEWTDSNHPSGENPGARQCGCENYRCEESGWNYQSKGWFSGKACMPTDATRPDVECSGHWTYMGELPGGSPNCRNDNLDSTSEICGSEYPTFEEGSPDKCKNATGHSINAKSNCPNKYDDGSNSCWKESGPLECDSVDGHSFKVKDLLTGGKTCKAQSRPEKTCTDKKWRYVYGKNYSVDEVEIKTELNAKEFDRTIPSSGGWVDMRLNRTYRHDFADEEVAWR